MLATKPCELRLQKYVKYQNFRCYQKMRHFLDFDKLGPWLTLCLFLQNVAEQTYFSLFV